MNFKGLNGWVNDSSFISINIEGGDNQDSIGDQVWISKDGTEMEIYSDADKDVLQDAINLFSSPTHKIAFKGALMRMGVEF